MKIALTTILLTMLTLMSSTGKTPQAAKDYEYIATIRLTSAEGKRLIAKGIAQNPKVRERLSEGVVIITRGTTNTYLAEELARLQAPRGAFVTGKIIPAGKADFARGVERVAEVVLVKGVRTQIGYEQALEMMGPDDIVFKGANLLNYERQQVAVNVGTPDGGTVGRLRKYTDNGRGRWIVPVGLKKDTSWDLEQCARIANSDASKRATVLLNVKTGGIYTEIEAIREFADVEVYPAAKGGVDGAEGGVSLMLCGSQAEVEKALSAVESIQGEAAFK